MEEQLDENEIAQYEDDINEILGSQGYYSVPVELSLNAVLKIKIFYEPQKGVDKNLILQYRLMDLPPELNLGLLRELIRNNIVDKLFSQIFSTGTQFFYDY